MKNFTNSDEFRNSTGPDVVRDYLQGLLGVDPERRFRAETADSPSARDLLFGSRPSSDLASEQESRLQAGLSRSEANLRRQAETSRRVKERKAEKSRLRAERKERLDKLFSVGKIDHQILEEFSGRICLYIERIDGEDRVYFDLVRRTGDKPISFRSRNL